MREQIEQVRLLVLDVDGVLTDGEMIYTDSGEVIKAFNCLDGLGLVMAKRAGLLTAIVTGRVSVAVERRAAELGIGDLVQGVRYKATAIHELMTRHELRCEQVAFMGDDINDIPAFNTVGFRIAPRSAANDVRFLADYVTEKPGGQGAVREVVEMILHAQGKWDKAVSDLLAELKNGECQP